MIFLKNYLNQTVYFLCHYDSITISLMNSFVYFRYNGMLKAKKSTMVPEHEFHQKEKV